MKPINFLSVNKTLTSENPNIDPLPVYRGQGQYISRWQADWHERLQILLHGKIWVSIASDKHPPISISGYQTSEFTHPELHP